MARKKIGEILIEAGLLTIDKLQYALNEQQKWGGPLGDILVKKKIVSEDILVQALSHQLNFPVVDVSTLRISSELKTLVPENFSSQHCLVPFKKEGKFLDIAMSRPLDMAIMDELRIRTKLNIRPHLAGPSQIRQAIQRNYGYGGQIGTSGYFRSDEIELEDPTTPQPEFTTGRNAEIIALQKRLLKLESLVARDENVLRKLMGLLIQKNVATREEILEAINR